MNEFDNDVSKVRIIKDLWLAAFTVQIRNISKEIDRIEKVKEKFTWGNLHVS